MTLDTAAILAAFVLVLLWPIHQHLTIRALRYALGRQREQLHQHARAIIQLQGAATAPPTSVGQPMPTVTRSRLVAQDDGELFATQAGLRSLRASESQPAPAFATDPDPTLRLRRPPAQSDIEALLAAAGRCLTPIELADRLERKPWDLLPEIERLTTAGRIKLVPGHTAGQSAYTLADPTMRLARMPVLPGLVS